MMIKVTGHLNGGYYSSEGNFVNPSTSKTFKKYGWRCKWFIFKCKLFWDWVEVEQDGKQKNDKGGN